MTRGPIVHAVLLVAALIFAYQTWTREEVENPKTGEVVVWSKPEAQLQSVVFEARNRVIRIERRSESGGSFLWGEHTRINKKLVKKEPEPAQPAVPEPKAESSATADNDPAGDPTNEEPEKPEFEETRTKSDFPIGEEGEKTMAAFAELRALRELGAITNAQKIEYGLEGDDVSTVTATFAEGAYALTVGGRIHGSSDRYVLNPDTNLAYAIAAEVLRPIMTGEGSLRLKKLHSYPDSEIQKVTLTALEQPAPNTRTLVQTTVENERGKKKSWADSETPDKPDTMMANVLSNINKLRVSNYETEVDRASLVSVVSVKHFDASGKQIGHLELYKQPAKEEPVGADETAGKKRKDPHNTNKKSQDASKTTKTLEKYFVVSERTRVPGLVSKAAAERIERDLAQAFLGEAPTAAPPATSKTTQSPHHPGAAPGKPSAITPGPDKTPKKKTRATDGAGQKN